MNKAIKIIFTLILVMLATDIAHSTHNRAGEITYRQISDYTFEFEVITFTNTKTTSNGVSPADRPELTVKWGDNTYSNVKRAQYIDLPDYYRKNRYLAQHTFPGPGTYQIVVEDPNRNEGVGNIPNSVTVVFSIKTILQINPIVGFNSTPKLLNPPVDKAAMHRKFIHNPAAFDPDGDSLSYKLTVCTGENGKPIPSYKFPDSSNKPIYIDAISGDLVWDSPTQTGIYNVAFFIEEWRKGIKIGQITRDMQIEVFDSKNHPPIIDSIKPKCVVAGDTLKFTVKATDKDNEDIVMSATGGVFSIPDSAIFTPNNNPKKATGQFTWATKCSHIRKAPYLVLFKATDKNATVPLVDQMACLIKVIAPAPQNIVTTTGYNNISLSWDNYTCPQAQGFYIYRKKSYFGFTPDSCETGVPKYTGYERIATITDSDITSFIDDNNKMGLTQGFTYCYMVTAFFQDKSESKASEEVCAELKRGMPIITNVSVTKHHKTNGEIYVEWSKPQSFDSTLFPAPLKYIVKRCNSLTPNNFKTIATLPSLNDTTFTDKNLNTFEFPYLYQIEIHNNNGLTVPPMWASSTFLNISVSNKTIHLNTAGNIPWTNNKYIIYRQDNPSATFDSIGFANNNTYTDKNLNNNQEYCYRVKTIGSYNLSGIKKPLINHSHQNCGIPNDTTPPPAPILTVESDCETFINWLNWQPQSPTDEILKYKIYFAENTNSKFNLIDSVLDANILNYKHILKDFPAGCYVVTATDMNNNESKPSNSICVDNCNYFELPNVFTPNNDGINDLFRPITPEFIVSRFIEKLDIKIYSRWGNLVYETTDPNINWNGTNKQSNKLVTPGVYYYVCDLVEKRISGKEERNVVGFIHVFHKQKNLQKPNNK